MKWVKVSDMYEYSKSVNTPLLSDFGSDDENISFWNDYVANYQKYDKLFRRMYLSFRYFLQQPISRFDELMEAKISDITLDFIDEVYNHLMVNAKKYEELYRINVVPDADYSIVDNYNVIETMDRETSKSEADVFGSRTDTTDDTIGDREDVSLGAIEGFNSNNFSDRDRTTINTGEQENSRNFLKGQQSDTHTGSGTEDYVFIKRGNIGVKTVSQVMAEHKNLWEKWEFYTYIFQEISSELLLV